MNGNVGKFQRAVDVDQTFEAFAHRYRDMNMRPQTLRRLFEKQKGDALYLSEFYQVAIDKDPPHAFPGVVMWHLSIKRIDKEPIMDWRDLQAIKSQLCGDEAEALQLFPAESRCVDTSNQYHLWVFMRSGTQRLPRIPCGWTKGMVIDEAASATSGAKQRRRADGEGDD